MGASQNEVPGTGSLPQGSVSWVCFVVCFGVCWAQFFYFPLTKFKGLFRGLSRRSVSGYDSPKSNSPPLFEVGHPKKYKPISIDNFMKPQRSFSHSPRERESGSEPGPLHSAHDACYIYCEVGIGGEVTAVSRMTRIPFLLTCLGSMLLSSDKFSEEKRWNPLFLRSWGNIRKIVALFFEVAFDGPMLTKETAT